MSEVALGDLQLLELGVARERDDLHAIAQRRRDRVERVGGADEEHLREVERQVEVVIAERCCSARDRALRAAPTAGRRGNRRRPCRSRRSSSPGLRVPASRMRAHDRARHRADVGAAMAADLGFVAHAADREPHELAAHRARDRLSERRLADAGRSDEAQDRSGQLLLELADGQDTRRCGL